MKYSCWLLILLTNSCAQVRSISGGEKDSTPPSVLFSNPPPFSTQFKSRSITLNFDEYVQLNNINQELVISPPLAHPPKIKVKHKSIVVDIEDELLPQTTYMFNFGDGITDVNENNKALDLLYVLSTGDAIDSMRIQGVVHDVFEDAPAKGYKVLLFENDTAIFSKNSIPLYFTKSKEDGSFVLPYLRGGSFFIYALEDLNSNYNWDAGEAIAIHDIAIQPTIKDSTLIKLSSSNPRSEKPVITDYLVDSIGSVRFTLDPFFHDVSIESMSGLETFLKISGDTITAWITGIPTNKKEEFKISWHDVMHDTIQIPFYTESQLVSFPLYVQNEKKINALDSILISSDVIMFPDSVLKISVVQDSVEIPVRTIFNEENNSLLCALKLLQGKSYTMDILPGAFRNISGGINDSLRYSFSTYKKEDLGILYFTLSGLNPDINYLFTIQNNSRRVFYEMSNVKNGSLKIADLPAGEYSAHLLEDVNNNRRFDPVNLISRAPSEINHVYPTKIVVRANWELKLDWNLSK